MIHFEIPKNQSSIIKVIGVGGGGSNAVNYMYNLGVEGVDFLVCNTDSQALAQSPIPNKIQLGPNLTSGLGAGANPEIGKQASEESLEDITKILKVNTRMAFITAGMGGGTGTGGAPVVAKACRDLDILTVGIVSTPFSYEGRKRMAQAQEGIARLRDHVDTILVISNDKLRQQCGNMPFRQAFAKADDILATAAKCITDVITSTGQINVDFADVCTVMKNGGVAILGSAVASGENRAHIAVEEALNSPLLNDNDIRGAKWILLNINSAEGEFEHTMDEAETIQAFVQQQAGDNCDVILGMGNDSTLGDKISVTVIATGFHHKEITAQMQESKAAEVKTVVSLGAVEAPAPAMPVAEETPVADPLAPRLKDEQTPEAKAEAPVSMWERNLDALQSAKSAEPAEPQSAETNFMGMTLHVRTEPVSNTTGSEMPVFERNMSAQEVEDKRRFEEQKRQLEERAERLRNLSFNVRPSDTASQSSDDIENVPAYLRKETNIDNSVKSNDRFYSGYTVGVQQHSDKAEISINTINTFLDGKKPD
ncbi:cell division protein FtsZ [Rurimicrobium arvi]|uniref:Cell division protein FtsZ n=1 Tax=Rurimicrobium arvi TaxID=2049916 RepID=A0ABP8MFA0_9BACT